MPSKNHGKKMRPAGAFSTPFWLLLVELLHSTCAKTMRRTQSLELSAAYYSTNPAALGRQSAKICAQANPSLRSFFRGKGRPILYPILSPRAKISRRDITYFPG